MKIKDKVAVLLGGPSSEREISIKSGTAVYEALLSLGVDAVCIDVGEDPVRQIRETGAGIAFIALHGRFGEDGTIQAMLEKEGIAYTGSGPVASRLAMDKLASRKIFKDALIPVPESFALKNGDRHQFFPINAYPLVVKPNREGSSIGLSVVNKKKDLAAAIDEAFSYDNDIIIEKFIDGDDITVGILNDKPLPVVHIKPRQGIYDYTAKYTQGATEYVVPAKLADNITKEAQRLGILAHRLLGCRYFSRVDMRLGRDNKITVLEVNTIPGMTATSLLPKAAKAIGIDFAHLCLMIAESAKANG